MGRRSAQAEENHWPGFVDALSTIVMVVTFLLIILAIVIFVLSQNIAKNIAQTYIEGLKEQTQGGGNVYDPNAQFAPDEFHSENELKIPDPATIPKVSQSTADFESDANEASKTEASTESSGVGDFKTSDAKNAQSNVPEIDAKDIEAPSRKVTDEEEKVKVTAVEQAETPETKVIQTASVLTLAFDPTSTKINEEAGELVQKFIQSNEGILNEANVNILAFADVESTSVSQARRVAYYRALSARNELIKGGFATERINVEIRLSNSSETADTVEIIVEP